MGKIKNGREVVKQRKPRRVFLKVCLLAIVTVIGLGYWLVVNRRTAFSPSFTDATIKHDKNNENDKTNEVAQETKLAPLKNIQSQINSFVSSRPGIYGIKIIDDQGTVLAEVNGDKQFFTASLYKLFVAFVGYQRIDNGKDDFNQPYLQGFTRGQCLDAMIRDSNSPCGEKMMNELNNYLKPEQLVALGFSNTSIGGLVTTANDTAIILQKISRGEGLSSKSKEQFLGSMKNQDKKFRLGLPSGFSSSTVYNKVGWNEDKEWHDASIVKLKNGREVVAAVLSDGAGYRNIASLGSVIEKALE